ncbi:MAG TPA: hypothetical protein VGX95_00160 [Xanthobacteraceae bacterium]|nr:hypothetical protein [Xanthobacteraceae bacterium]
MAIDIFMAALLDTGLRRAPRSPPAARRRREPQPKRFSDSMPCTHFCGEQE